MRYLFPPNSTVDDGKEILVLELFPMMVCHSCGCRSSDPSVASEFLQIINSKAGVLDLEVIPDISPSLKLLLLSDQSKYWTIALRILSTLLHSFGDLIRNVTNRSGNTTLGVDLSFDQRRLKCLAAKSSLEDLCPGLQLRSQQNGTVGRQAEELHLRLAEL